MAKKKEVLSIEEKLEKALVPDWEQPYQVPENWCWTRLGEVYNLYTGNSINATVKANKYTGITEGLNYIATKDVGMNTKIEYDNGIKISDYDKFKIAKKNTALMCIEGGSAGKKVGYLEEDVCFGNKLCTFDSKLKNNKVLFYYLLSNEFMMSFQKNHHGLIGGVSVAKLKAIDIPLPPLAEQKRIVARIESLFSKLDEAKELAQSALDSFENRKSAIFHKAFIGELTKKWREENGVGIESWKCLKLEDIVQTVKDKYNPTIESTDLTYIGLEHIEKNNGIISYGSSEDVKSLKTRFLEGDILYGKLRPYLNKHDITKFHGICSTDILVFRANNTETAKYVNYFMNSSFFIDYAVSNSKGINLPRVSEKDLNIFKVNLPTLPEQAEIVRILDNIFEKETKAKECANVTQQIDLMKKAILARAFRGELGTNDESEESAMGLLKEILERN